MRRLFPLLALPLLLLPACRSTPNYNQALPLGAPALIPVTDPDELPDFGPQWAERDEILTSLDRSLVWTHREHAQRFFPIAGITHDRALRSLERFRELLLEASGPAAFDTAIRDEFQVYKSAGWDGRGGGVLFTAYCTPLLEGSLERDEVYRYPLYAQPEDLVKGKNGEILGWQTIIGLVSYPSRGSIEENGLLDDRGLELVWLRDPIDAYIAHVNGSAFVLLPHGDEYRLGYAGKNGREYTSLGRELIADGRVDEASMSVRGIRDWAAREDPEIVRDYLWRNESYVFFQPIDGTPHGSLDFPVQSERSLATDKTLFPRGALVFVQAEIPEEVAYRAEPFEKFMFDQDTGGAIRTAGRADIYLGVGSDAEERAGRAYSEGQLFYLFLKE